MRDIIRFTAVTPQHPHNAPTMDDPLAAHKEAHSQDCLRRYEAAESAAWNATCHKRCPERFKCSQRDRDPMAAYVLRDLAVHTGYRYDHIFRLRDLAENLCMTHTPLVRALSRLACRGLIRFVYEPGEWYHIIWIREDIVPPREDVVSQT